MLTKTLQNFSNFVFSIVFIVPYLYILVQYVLWIFRHLQAINCWVCVLEQKGSSRLFLFWLT